MVRGNFDSVRKEEGRNSKMVNGRCERAGSVLEETPHHAFIWHLIYNIEKRGICQLWNLTYQLQIAEELASSVSPRNRLLPSVFASGTHFRGNGTIWYSAFS
jgi:hypothetical protein